MRKVSNYTKYNFDREFESIIFDLLKVIESDEIKVGDTFEWDIESKKSDFRKYINILKNISSPITSSILNRIKSFISKLDIDQVKEYFNRLITELKDLPYSIKKDLFVKISLIIFSVTQIPISDLISDNGDPILKEVLDIVVNKSGSSFNSANNLVSFAEGGYTENSIDAGNYTSGPFNKSGYLIGTNHGIAAFTLISTNIKQSTKVELNSLKQSYGNRYKELCGNVPLSFKEQWDLDQKYINKSDIGVKWKNIMKSLHKSTATDIYRSEYWNPQGFDNIKNQSIANILYDACVNQGPGVSKRVLINSMSKLGFNINYIKSWGDVNTKLTPIINKMDNIKLRELHKSIKDNRLNQYLSNADPNEEKEFMKGWMNRLEKPINKFI